MTEPKKLAKQYLDRVIATQKTLGYVPHVSPERYAESLSQLEKTFVRMAMATNGGRS